MRSACFLQEISVFHWENKILGFRLTFDLFSSRMLCQNVDIFPMKTKTCLICLRIISLPLFFSYQFRQAPSWTWFPETNKGNNHCAQGYLKLPLWCTSHTRSWNHCRHHTRSHRGASRRMWELSSLPLLLGPTSHPFVPLGCCPPAVIGQLRSPSPVDLQGA